MTGELMQAAEQLRQQAIDLGGLFLDCFDEERPPDRQERVHIAKAIHLLRCGEYDQAIAEI